MHDNETEKCEALGACQIKNSLVLKQETKTQKEWKTRTKRDRK